MNPYEFARQYLYPYKMKGCEIVPTYCPFCNGGRNKDKDTFALNVDKLTFNCMRGSCGKTGAFYQLCKEFGEEADKMDTFEMYKPKRVYKKPETKVVNITTQAESYCQKRGISKATMDLLKVGCDSNGNIIFPYYENGELVFIKFRPSRKVEKGERKAWREEGGKPILWNMDLCTTDKPLIITEGEFDTLACYEAGLTNVVSVPSGAEDFTWLETCWDWVNKFEKVILFGDSDEPGKEMVRKLILKLGEYRCYTVENKYKDANEILFHEGKEKLKETVLSAKPIPIAGLIDLADVTPFDLSKAERVKSNILYLDQAIGGFFMGEVSVWTGKRGEGKSTILGQMLLESVNDGVKVCAYSGELRADRFQYWINLQAAGRRNVSKRYDSIKGKEVSFLDKDTVSKIKEWYRGKFFLYDNDINSENTEESSILKLFTYAVKRYDCKVFLIDNLMTARYDTGNDKDYYRAQSNFVGELVSFANRYNVHIHLVAHPRKTKDSLTNDEVSGSGDITNRAHNVLSLERNTDNTIDCNVVLKILKNRSDGAKETIGLNYDSISRRLYLPSIGPDKRYSWETEPVQVSFDPEFPDCPF